MPGKSRRLVTASWLLQIKGFDKVHEILFPGFQYVEVNLHVYDCVRSIIIPPLVICGHTVGNSAGWAAWDEHE